MSGSVRVRRVARITLEFTAPFLVASGKDAVLADAVPVLDANGLPAIPGSSLGGVIRHAYEDVFGEERARDLFGFAEGDDGHGSRTWFTWAHIHDAGNVPVEGLVNREAMDPVLENALTLVVRDHVRIGHRGAAEKHGKFDEEIVPAGHRFTFEMTMEGPPEAPSDQESFDWILAFLASGRGRIGGGGRRGLGAFRIAPGGCRTRTFDLGNEADAAMFAAHPVRLDRASAALESIEPPPLSDRSWRELRLALQPTGYWAFDAPEPWNLEGEDSADTPDFNPVREARVIWSNGSGDVGEAEMYIPGSSVKGAISHRVAFHANRAARVFADLQEESASPGDASGEGNPAVRDLFGSIHRSPRAGKNGDDEPEEESGGSAGKVYLDDVRIPAHFHGRLQRVMHNSSDRFTGGVRAGILFEERVLYRGDPLEVTLRVKDFDGLRSETLAALREALRDLSEGRLQLGAGGGRGHGYFKSVRPFDELWAEFTGGVQ